MSLLCSGCGASLQMEREGEKGYVSGPAFLREYPLCQRCYRLIHYGELTPVSVTAQEYRETLEKALKRPSLILYVVDLFDFNGSLVKGIATLLRGHEMVMAINKYDLFPLETKPERVKGWAIREARKQELEVREAFVVSAKNGMGIDDLLHSLEERAKGRPVVVLGMANVGKSTLLNRMISMVDQDEGQKLTTSLYPGTTLGMVNVSLPGGNLTFTDTPGLLGAYRVMDRVCSKSLKDILPNDRLRPKAFQLTPEQTLFLGGLARIDFIKGDPQSLVVYAANQLKVHRTKLSRADQLYVDHVGELLTPPCDTCANDLQPLLPRQFRFTRGQPFDFVISGLGFIRFGGFETQLIVHVPKGVEVTIRPSLLGGKRSTGEGKKWPISRRISPSSDTR